MGGGDSTQGLLDCESGILPLGYRAPRYLSESLNYLEASFRERPAHFVRPTVDATATDRDQEYELRTLDLRWTGTCDHRRDSHVNSEDQQLAWWTCERDAHESSSGKQIETLKCNF